MTSAVRDPEHWRSRAKEARALAELIIDPESKPGAAKVMPSMVSAAVVPASKSKKSGKGAIPFDGFSHLMTPSTTSRGPRSFRSCSDSCRVRVGSTVAGAGKEHRQFTYLGSGAGPYAIYVPILTR